MPAQALSMPAAAPLTQGSTTTTTQSARTMPTPPPKTRHYRADIPEMCHAKLQADSRRPAERIRPKGEREVALDIVLRILMQRERYSAQDFPPSYIIDRPAAD